MIHCAAEEGLRTCEAAVIDNCSHLAVVEGADCSVILECDLRYFIFRIYGHLEYVRSYSERESIITQKQVSFKPFYNMEVGHAGKI